MRLEKIDNHGKLIVHVPPTPEDGLFYFYATKVCPLWVGFGTACVFWSGLARGICHLSPFTPKPLATVVSVVWPLIYLHYKGVSSLELCSAGKWKENSSGKEKENPRRA